nr:nuclear receptor 2C2 associated protein [Hymenolepis microstoma]
MTVPDYISRVTVSSVLNKNTQLYGKQFLFDGKPDTCWQSDSGAYQWIRLSFTNPTKLASLDLQFQGGFVAEEATLQLWNDPKDDKIVLPFYPANSNCLQTFKFTQEGSFSNAAIIFKKSTDFYGRIVIYKLELTPA